VKPAMNAAFHNNDVFLTGVRSQAPEISFSKIHSNLSHANAPATCPELVEGPDAPGNPKMQGGSY